jgi:hypothetical protein
MRKLLLVFLAGCAALDTTADIAEGYVDDGRSPVYTCEGRNPDGSAIEYCWDGPEWELEDGVGLECHVTTPVERFGPAVIGCWYHCDDNLRGCNAHNSCWCP